MRFLIIIPTHNEEENILLTLKSLAQQTFQDFLCVVVNDGSTDQTRHIVENYIADHPKFKIQNLELSSHEPGAKVVRTFNKGLASVDSNEFDIICKFDADLIFPSDYLSKINEVYETNSKAGMVSGLVRIKTNNLAVAPDDDFKEDNQQWKFENISSKNHIRGPIKSYRIKCFQDMNGLRPVLGWDNIDVMLAQKNGWETITIKDLWVKHLRPTAYQYKDQKAKKLGEYFYNIGLDLPLALISSGKSSFKNRSILEFFTTMKTFLDQREKINLSAEEIKFIRKLRWNQILSKK